ncbi:hypothetical protein [Actinomadura sp. 3N508]
MARTTASDENLYWRIRIVLEIIRMTLWLVVQTTLALLSSG